MTVSDAAESFQSHLTVHNRPAWLTAIGPGTRRGITGIIVYAYDMRAARRAVPVRWADWPVMVVGMSGRKVGMGKAGG